MQSWTVLTGTGLTWTYKCDKIIRFKINGRVTIVDNNEKIPDFGKGDDN